MRPDVRFILPARTPRHYRFGEVSDYIDLVSSTICAAPVYTAKELPDLEGQFELQAENINSRWKQLVPPDGKPSDFCN